MSIASQSTVTLLVIVSLVAATGGPVTACDRAGCSVKGATRATQAPAPAESGMRVYIDEKGNFLQQPPPGQEIAAPVGVEPTAEMVQIEHPDGSVELVVPPVYDSHMVVTKKADGTLEFNCVQPALEPERYRQLLDERKEGQR